jgi:hypothetical protein
MTISSKFNKLKKSVINTFDYVIHPYGLHDPIPVPESHETDQARLWDEWQDSVRESERKPIQLDINLDIELVPRDYQYIKPKEPYVDPIKYVSPWDRFSPK